MSMGFEMDRVKLFMDGNCGCALLGEDLGSGEVEFVVLDEAFRTQWPNLTERELERAACKQAYHNLIVRLGRPLSFVYLPPMEWIQE